MKIQLLAMALLFAATGLKAQQANFSGTWTRNTEKCNPGDLSINSTPIGLSIKQMSNQIEITRVSKNYKGDTSTYRETLKSDNSTASTIIKAGLNKRSSIQWAADHRSFAETADYSDDNGNSIQKGKDQWTLSEDGKTLTIQSTLTLNGQDHELTEVYDRK